MTAIPEHKPDWITAMGAARRNRICRYLALGAAALPLSAVAGCGAAQPTLSTNWSSIGGATLVSVDNRGVVVGVDTHSASARSLALIPTPPNADTVSGALITRRTDGQTLVAQPSVHGGPMVYRVVHGSKSLAKVGVLNNDAHLYAFAAGFVQAIGRGDRTQIFERADNLRQSNEFNVSAPSSLASTDGADGLCLVGTRHGAGRATVVDLTTKRVTSQSTVPSGASALACIDHSPVVGIVEQVPGGATLRPARSGPGSVLSISHGSLGALVPDRHQVLAAVTTKAATLVYRASPRTKAIKLLARIPHLSDINDAFIAGKSLVLVADNRGALISLGRGTVRTFLLPGTSYPQ